MAAPSPMRIDLPGSLDPHRALRRLEGVPGRVLLESGGPRGRFTLLAARPVAVYVAGGADDPFAGLEELLRRYGSGGRAGDESLFRGAAIGFLAYEAGRWLERLPSPRPDDVGMPEGWFGVYESAVVWDRETGRCRASAVLLPGRTEGEVRGGLEELARRVTADPPARSRATEADATAAEGVGAAAAGRVPIVSSLAHDRFVTGVERVREYVRAGDLFQANLTRRLTAATKLTGTELYERLVRETPAQYSAYLDTGSGEIVSASPELFLSVRDGRVVTSPIKGTAPRGSDPEEDGRLRERLAASAKDRAENVMIVDLLRNDLSRVARPGSVEVPRLAEIETHPTVHHLVSSVSAELAEGVGPVDLLRATFPGGSVTGAPKIRAMELLAELEPVPRGVYTGAVGMIGLDGAMDLSIAIRTAVLRDGRAHYGTGAGITLASEPESEWAETEDKALAFVRAVR